MAKTAEQIRRDKRAYYYRVTRPQRQSQKPPDHLLKMTSEELAYMAGLIDGEGCLRIAHIGPRKKTYYPMVCIAMTHRETIEWVAQKWKAGSIKRNNHTATNNGAWRVQWVVRIHGMRAQLLCRLLLPYLITKRENAQLIIEFPGDCRRGGITDDIQKIRRAAFLRMKDLNRRGPGRSYANAD